MSEQNADTKLSGTPKQMLAKVVKQRIDGNKAHGWGVDDSLAVIVALFEQETGEAPDQLWRDAVKMVINPSAFRQALEKAGQLAPNVKVPSNLAGLFD